MNEQLTAAAVLNRAADLIMERGWTRAGDYVSKQGHLCAVGAIRTAVCGGPTDDYYNASERQADLVAEAEEVLRRFIDVLPISWTIWWNDTQTDRRKVVRTLRRAAKAAAKV